MSGSKHTSAGTTPALTPQQMSVVLGVLAEVREANETDLRSAREKLATFTAEGGHSDATMREIIAGAEYMLEDATGILNLVDSAEQRVRAGDYGLCSACGVAIPFERLRLRPYVSTCIACS